MIYITHGNKILRILWFLSNIQTLWYSIRRNYRNRAKKTYPNHDAKYAVTMKFHM